MGCKLKNYKGGGKLYLLYKDAYKDEYIYLHLKAEAGLQRWILVNIEPKYFILPTSGS